MVEPVPERREPHNEILPHKDPPESSADAFPSMMVTLFFLIGISGDKIWIKPLAWSNIQ